MKLIHRATVLAGSVLALSAISTLAACVGDKPAPLDDDPTADGGPQGEAGGGGEGGPGGSDGGGGGDAADGGDAAPGRFCTTQMPLPGVTNFFCADFDGTKADEGFTKASIPDAGGGLTLNDDIFVSEPHSLTTTGDATLAWTSTAAGSISEITAKVEVNPGTVPGATPPASGHVTLLKISGASTNLTLNYANGATVEGSTSYQGYYLTVVTCPSACAIFEHALKATIKPNVWNDIAVVWSDAGTVRVLIDNVPVYNEAMAFEPTTSMTTTLGLVGAQPVPAIPRHAFDNLRISVRR